MKYVDLFAGCGGLSLGLERAGFELVLAVEKSEMAAHTFYHNFIERINDDSKWREFDALNIEDQFKKKLLSKQLGELLQNEKLLKQLKNRKIDIVVGGPPCQGFSLAGRRNPEDERNKLPWQFLEFVERINPKAVVIENVVGISRTFKKHDKDAPFDQLQEALKVIGQGYEVQPIHINAMHFGVPEHRPRLMILGIRKDVAKKKNLKSTNQLWYSTFLDQINTLPDLAPIPTINEKDVRDLRTAISDLTDHYETYNNPAAKKFRDEMSNHSLWNLRPISPKKIIPNHNFSIHQEKTINRFKLYQYLNEQCLASNILNIPATHGEQDAINILRKLLSPAEFPAFSPDGKLLAKTKHDLIKIIFDLKTKKHSQRALSWEKPSPTIVTLPDDYIHPVEPRIFSVRELARLQSFPDAFEFKSKETTGSDRRKFEVPQYSQVGNAVAPLVAYAVGKKFYEILSE